jgi:hypothetical protein
VIVGGTTQERCAERTIHFKRKNNRSLQKNRKGFAPSIRKQRHSIQPKDAVGIKNRGAYLKMTDGVKVIVFEIAKKSDFGIQEMEIETVSKSIKEQG